MKPNTKNEKLTLNKQSISKLTDAEQIVVRAGEAASEDEAAWTTSIGHCTGILCCGPSQTCTWTGTIISATITIIL